MLEIDRVLHSKRIDSKGVEYLKTKLDNLYIEIGGKYKGSLFELMSLEKLENWSHQTTESAIVFLNDDDYIERGTLKVDDGTKEFTHSWICFKVDDIKYVFDPSLNFLCQKSFYSKVFDIDVKGKVFSKEVREELIRQLTTPKNEKSKYNQSFESSLKNIMGKSYDNYMLTRKEEVMVPSLDDIASPLYKNGAGYRAEIDNKKIKKLAVHYYWLEG